LYGAPPAYAPHATLYAERAAAAAQNPYLAGAYGAHPYADPRAAAHAAHLQAVAPGSAEAFAAAQYAGTGHYPTWANVYSEPAKPAAAAEPAAAQKPAKTKGKGTVSCPRNPNFAEMAGGYLFPVIGKKRREFVAANPDVKLISLGIGDTTHPMPTAITKAMADYAMGLSTWEGYAGYDPKENDTLKQKIVDVLYSADGKPLVDTSEVIISDGSKCDLGRIQPLFGNEAKVAVQDPAYPVYVDSSVMNGRFTKFNEETKQYEGITYMPCHGGNDFFPDLEAAKDCDVIMFCNPNNPTGACATRAQLQTLVDFARANGQIILYDAAYSAFIKDPNCPRTIYEIEGAREVAIESNSFSKLAGFTGVRLGWTICPKDIKWADGTPVHQDWSRIMATVFNGAPNVAIVGGIATLENLPEVMSIVEYYMANAKLVKDTMTELGFKCYGGDNAPYVFVHFPGRDSWDVFDEILNKVHVVTTPGVGFGPSGQGYVRISSFGSQADCKEACDRLKAFYGKK